MFKKLKEKITEEVKSSPQRFQQLTQSVSDRLQNSSNSDENFFSIGDDDANTSAASIEPGFTNVSLTSPQETKFRRNSSSSIASDVSFLPRYESVANMYHLQSDLDISASEIEDNASTSSQLGHLSKEQIYSAFQKSQMRYHKYRGRYTDLAKHYKELERENGKMKSVLVETQDKAIRRVTELREQCALEQKAKAHLEGALRDEIDEKQFKIQSLQTKIELLQNGSMNQDTENLENLNKYLTEARQEIESLNQRIQEMKANAIIFQTKEQEYKTKVGNLEREISLFSEREKENNLTLAQNKMELHNELLSKDHEISALKKSLEGNNKLENLQTQNKKLIEKLENLTQKCNTYENELLKLEQSRIEVQNSNQLNLELRNKLKETEDKLEEVRADTKRSLLNLESKIRDQLEKEFEEKEESVRAEFQEKFEEISSNADNLQEIQLTLIENDEEIRRLREALSAKAKKCDDLERDHLQLIEDGVKISRLQEERLRTLEEQLEEEQRRSEENVKVNMKLTRDAKEKKKNLEARIEEEREKFLHKLDESEKSVKKLEEAGLSLNEELAEAEKKSVEFEATNRNLEEEIRRLKIEAEELAKKGGEQGLKKLEEAEKKSVELEERNASLCSKIKSTEEEIRKLSSLKTEAEELVTKRDAEMSSLRDSLKKLETKNEELQEGEKKSVQLEAKNRNLEEAVQELSGLKTEAEALVKKRDEEVSSLLDNRKKLETKYEESLVELDETGKKAIELEARNSSLSLEIKSIEEENRKLGGLKMEAEELVKKRDDEILSLRDSLKNLETKNVEAEKKSVELEETNSSLSLQIKSMEEEIQTLSSLRIEVEEVEESVRKRDEEMSSLRASLTKLEEERERLSVELRKARQKSAELEETNRNLEEEIRKIPPHEELVEKLEDDRRSLIEETDLLKKLLEEANNNVTVKEHDSRKIEENYRISEERVQSLITEVKNERDKREKELEVKNVQIGALSKKLEDYHELIEERDEKFFKVLSNFPEPPNHFKRDKRQKNLENLEEKLQSFEQTFSMEKENLSKIIICLKQFEERHSSVLNEKKRLEEERNDLLGQITELQGQILENSSTKVSVKLIEEELTRLKEENARLIEDEEKLKQNILEVESRNTQVVSDSNFLSEENTTLLSEIESIKLRNEEVETKYDICQRTITDLKLEKASDAQKQLQELERHINELQHEKQLLREEIQELKTAPLNLQNSSEEHAKELETLRTKIVQYKSLDLTNRSSIDFYENELQKLKNQNEKLNRKLDETLVTLNHCSELSNSTEIEYLKNVLYNYMLGKESLVLARVIAAVCKFDPHQTEVVLAKEQQKQTLLGQLGIL